MKLGDRMKSEKAKILTEKYRPMRLSKFVGNAPELKKVKLWLLNWKRGIKSKPLLIHGPIGVGKTSLAHAVADEFGFEIYEFNISQEYTKEQIKNLFNISFTSSTITGKPRMLLIDDVDKVCLEKGVQTELTRLLRVSPFPIILTAENPWARSLSSVRGYCEHIRLKRPNKYTLERFLMLIAEREGIKISMEKIRMIVEATNGDIRAALNDLQGSVSSSRNTNINIMDALRRMFRAEDMMSARMTSFMTDVDPDMFALWVEENIQKEYKDPYELAEAFRFLSRADVFRGRVKRRNAWGFLRYSMTLLTAGVALSKRKKKYQFVPYSFPSFIKYMSGTKEQRRITKSIVEKVRAKGIHGPNKKLKEMIPIIKAAIQRYGKEAVLFYGFDADEVAVIMNTSKEKAKEFM